MVLINNCKLCSVKRFCNLQSRLRYNISQCSVPFIPIVSNTAPPKITFIGIFCFWYCWVIERIFRGTQDAPYVVDVDLHLKVLSCFPLCGKILTQAWQLFYLVKSQNIFSAIIEFFESVYPFALQLGNWFKGWSFINAILLLDYPNYLQRMRYAV